MIESFTIFTRGGLVLWKHEASTIEGDPLAHLVQDALIQPLTGTQQYTYNNYILRWQYANDLNLVFVACYLKITRNFPVDDLLTAVRNAFTNAYKDSIAKRVYQPSYSFDQIYTSILDKIETKSILSRPRPQQNKTRSKGGDGDEAGKSKKKPTRWDHGKVSSTEAATLNFSEPDSSTASASSPTNSLASKYGISDRDLQTTIETHGSAPTVGESYWEEPDVVDTNDEPPESDSGVWGYLKGLVGQKELTLEDLDGVSKQFTEKLVSKNVAPEVAQTLVDTVVSGLVGKRLGTLNTMYTAVKQELQKALTMLLTPKTPVDILTGVAKAKAENRPYSIVFCGVNGVGKSTSLAKIASYFLAQGLKVGVAACDTFRSGAIEQLKTHCAALEIPLYDRGYGKDEASVAADGIRCAKKDKCDVILIDTAGRMQGNDPLMKGLARLMNTNNPDLILFVGEALVGNDGCDQLINFNRSLAENSGKQHPRLIDGIVLTKFDTIDDKVGAAISMTHSTGQPILFVGTGQGYRDLKTPNPAMLVRALLS